MRDWAAPREPGGGAACAGRTLPRPPRCGHGARAAPGPRPCPALGAGAGGRPAGPPTSSRRRGRQGERGGREPGSVQVREEGAAGGCGVGGAVPPPARPGLYALVPGELREPGLGAAEAREPFSRELPEDGAVSCGAGFRDAGHGKYGLPRLGSACPPGSPFRGGPFALPSTHQQRVCPRGRKALFAPSFCPPTNPSGCCPGTKASCAPSSSSSPRPDPRAEAATLTERPGSLSPLSLLPSTPRTRCAHAKAAALSTPQAGAEGTPVDRPAATSPHLFPHSPPPHLQMPSASG